MAALALVDPPEAITDAVKKEYSIVHFQYPDNREIKEISIGDIYKQPKTLLSRFNFAKPYKIMTVEEKLSIKKYKDIYLVCRDDIRSYRSKYQFLHIGLVQFSIDGPSIFSTETLTLSVSLRDSKYPNLQDSILVSFDSDMLQGAIKFNWFPNFSAPLSDLANSNALVVTIDPPGSHVLYVRYMVIYKLMKTSLEPDYLFENPVLEVNTEKTNVVLPKSNNQS